MKPAAYAGRLNFAFRARLPVTLQNEVAECGLACVAMIASYYGYRTTLAEMRKRFCVSITGSSVRTIAAIADAVGLSSRPLRVELTELGRLRTPAILHWRLDHFVVLKAIRRRGVVVHDPAHGKRLVIWPDVSRFFTGIAVEMMPNPSFEKKTAVDAVRIRDLWTRSRGLGGSLARLVLLSAILQLFALLSPLINQLVVDEAIAKNDADFLFAILVGFGLLLVAQVAVESLRGAVSLYFGQMLSFQLRSNVVRHVLRLPVGYFEKRHVGDIVSRIASLVPIQNLISSAVITVLLDGLLGIVTFVVMLAYSPPLALVVLAASALGFVSRIAVFPHVRRLTEEKVHSEAELQTVLLETIRAVRAVKLFGREAERLSRWQDRFVDATNVDIQLQKVGIVSTAGSRLLLGATELAVFYLGGQAVLSGTMTIGMLFAFQAYRMQFTARVRELVTQFIAFRTVGIHLERLADLVHADPEITAPPAAIAAVRLEGGIELRSARFRYGDDQPWILDGVDVRIGAGERVAIVGESGGGKTTLLKALVGLHALDEGELLFDGVPLRALGIRTVRNQIGVVMQDDRLLSGTLAENICFFDEVPDMAKIVAASEQAHIHADIRRMPMGFHTLIGDMGSALSGGQRQRLLLARALYREPQILFLDEGTANLDAASERLVLDTLATLDITQVIVAHRSAAISACQRVLRVTDGKVIDV